MCNEEQGNQKVIQCDSCSRYVCTYKLAQTPAANWVSYNSDLKCVPSTRRLFIEENLQTKVFKVILLY